MIKQLTVFLENTQGRLAAVCRCLGDAGINMQALTIADTSDYGLVRIICDDPEPICKYITETLGKSATVFKAEGAYAHGEKTVVLSVMKRSQAVMLRNYVHNTQPGSFIMITNSSEIIGKGFRGLN